MGPLSSLAFAFLALGVTWCQGRSPVEDQSHRPVLQQGERSKDIKPRTSIEFSGKDYYSTNDTTCVIMDSSFLALENCHEQVEISAPIVFRKDWDSERELENVPVQFVVVKDGGHHCYSTVDCLSQIQSMRRRVRDKSCDLRENFYVGGDGKVYEGRGWNFASYWYLNGLSKRAVTVQFLGSYETTSPSPEAIEAFNMMMQIGLGQKKLSKKYWITSIRQLKMDGNESADVLHQVSMESNRWVSSQKLSSFWEYKLPERLTFVRRRDWNARNPTKEIAVNSQPVDYVAISETGDGCSTRSECIAKMLTIQDECIQYYGDLLDNFYIGQGGEVYEGRGWNSAPQWYIKGLEKRYLSIRLLGSYGNELPSWKVINSFKLLVEMGVWLGKVSPEYRIFTLRQIYNQSVLLGDPLFDLARKWSKWSQDGLIKPRPDSFGLVPFVSRSEWKAKKVLSIPSKIQPVRLVMIGDGGSRCFSNDQCYSRLRSEEGRGVEVGTNVLENFYVGDDGNVYEGRGWDPLPFFKTPLITVNFLGSFQDTLPSEPGSMAFLAFLDAGIAAGKISRDYKMSSFRHVYNDSSFLGDELSLVLEGMTAWDKDLFVTSHGQPESAGILPIYQLDHSTSHTTPTGILSLKLPVKYVVVGDSGEPCFTHETCRAELLRRQSEEDQLFGGLTSNFYVGGDGSVFAGRGWNSTSHWHVRGIEADTVFITFLGRFQNDLPSRYALFALKYFVKLSVTTGMIADDFRIISARQVYPNDALSGEKLARFLMTWGRWSDYSAHLTGGESIPFGPSAFVSKSKWSEFGDQSQISVNLKFPVNHLIVLDAGESCTSLVDCIMRVQAEENRTNPEPGDMLENFYIGEDGRIYEGRGWAPATQWHSINPNYDFITVAFLGKFHTQPPSTKALIAFEYFLKEGIMVEKLSANYSIVSLRQFVVSGEIIGEALDKYIRTLDNWSNDTSAAQIMEKFGIISPTAWGMSQKIVRFYTLFHPLKFLYIRECGLPCSTNIECNTRMKTAESDEDGITENFYIGGTGEVFEGIGWKYDPMWTLDWWQYSITVCFFGSFDSSLPSENAIAAFRAFCNYGVGKGFIDSNYKILYIPDTYKSKNWVGSEFKKLIMTWDRWVAIARM